MQSGEATYCSENSTPLSVSGNLSEIYIVRTLTFVSGHESAGWPTIPELTIHVKQAGIAHTGWGSFVYVCDMGTSHRLWNISGLVHRKSAAASFPFDNLVDRLGTAWSFMSCRMEYFGMNAE